MRGRSAVSPLLGLMLAACGSRTALPTPEPCRIEGAQQRCSDACGPGVRTCTDGYWHACVVVAVTRSCDNVCGTGTQQCTNGVWESDCHVPDVTRSCTNDCGSGTQQCSDGVWQTDCTVPPATRSCSNDCGSGTEECLNGKWGECKVPIATRGCATVCGSGTEQCIDGDWQNCDAPKPKPPKLLATIRDFRDSFPDMELPISSSTVDPGIVQDTLGADDKPIYAGNPTTRTTTGKANFDQWYRDVPNVNMTTTKYLQLIQAPGQPGLYQYPGREFFPIDNQLFGNQGRPHNYHFTLEVATQFKYIGGETFSFTGDDDLWAFINRRLAIDLGGLHPALSASVNLDSAATQLGIKVGNVYSLHLFFAERHTVDSDFIVETTIADVPSCE